MTKQAIAGSLESNDVFITIRPQPAKDNTVLIESIVMKQFGPAITKLVDSVLQEMDISFIQVEIKDRGALECTLKARLETAIHRYRELA